MTETLQSFESEREALAEKLKLKDQWEAQVKALNQTGILEILPESMDIGIVGIDGKEYPIPKYEDIIARLTPEKLEILNQKAEQGFTRLLLVPLAMPLEVLIERYKRELLKHAEEGKLFSTDKTPLELDKENPIYVWDQYPGADIDGRLVYFPKEFSENHQGKTKQELIDQGDAWQILLLPEEADIPAQNKGKTISGRSQLEAGNTPNEYLQTIQEDPQYQNEQGLTPEGWLTYAITHLHQTNQQIDDRDGNGKVCYLLGSYFPAVSSVPGGRWDRGSRQACLGRGDPGGWSPDYGARPSVNI